jgi:hypothetical protein
MKEIKTEVISIDELRKQMERSFVHGELSALQWCVTIKSLSKEERDHITSRISRLNKFLSGEIKADHDGTKGRWVPDFYKGEL